VPIGTRFHLDPCRDHSFGSLRSENYIYMKSIKKILYPRNDLNVHGYKPAKFKVALSTIPALGLLNLSVTKFVAKLPPIYFLFFF
jgi:hypothetical protein